MRRLEIVDSVPPALGSPSKIGAGLSMLSSTDRIPGFVPLVDGGHPDEGAAWKVLGIDIGTHFRSTPAMGVSNVSGRIVLHPPALSVGASSSLSSSEGLHDSWERPE